MAVHLEVLGGLHLTAAPAHFLAFFQHGILQQQRPISWPRAPAAMMWLQAAAKEHGVRILTAGRLLSPCRVTALLPPLFEFCGSAAWLVPNLAEAEAHGKTERSGALLERERYSHLIQQGVWRVGSIGGGRPGSALPEGAAIRGAIADRGSGGWGAGRCGGRRVLAAVRLCANQNTNPQTNTRLRE